MQVIDVTRQEEYDAITSLLPNDLKALLSPRMSAIEEIALDLGANLKIKVDGLRVEYPRRITETDLQGIQQRVGKFRDDGRRGLRGTLHRVSAEFNPDNLIDKLTIRVGKAIMGVAEPLRPWVERARGIAVIGPPAVGKTTLLRDVTRIRAEVLGSGLIVVDTSNEITGDGEEPHPMLARVRRVQVGDPDQQAPKLSRAIKNHGPEEVLVDEVGYNGDVPLIVSASKRGVSVIATMHGEVLHDVLLNPDILPLLGVSVNERDGSLRKLARACFTLGIEVRGKGKYLVHENLDEAVTSLLQGETPEGIQVGRW